MKVAVKRLFVAGFLVFSFLGINAFSIAPQVHAQSAICDIFPFIKQLAFGAGTLCGDTVDGKDAVNAAQALITVALQLVFVGIIVISIYIIIRAAIKYIRSEGDESKIQEAQKAIKSVFIGIAALFIGIIGIVIILAFFNAGTGGEINLDDVVPPSLLPDESAAPKSLGNSGIQPS